MKHVRQLDKYGCGPACLAMLCDLSYEEARQLWPGRKFSSNKGISRTGMDTMLAKLGYAVCRRFDTRLPFGDMHLVEVQDEQQVKRKLGYHYVVMDSKGRVFDPDEGDTRFRLADYYHVRAVAAVAHICASDGIEVFHEIPV